jgi:hypothetical protein
MPLDVNLDGKLYAKKSGLSFCGEQEDYNPYDDEESMGRPAQPGYFLDN